MTTRYKVKPPEERFWPKVEKRNGCWWWTTKRFGGGCLEKRGAFLFHMNPEVGQVLASRAAWIFTYGVIPEGKHVLHTCHNGDRGCVNPEHLYLGSQQDNMRDMVEADRQAKGAQLPQSKLTVDQVVMIRCLAEQGFSGHALAKRFGVSYSGIYQLLRGETWKHVG